jgi:hypothetical protein
MKLIGPVVLALILAAGATAQSAEPPLSDTRLTVNTLVREDIFAGFMANDLTRLTNGERNIQRLLSTRPAEQGELFGWQAGAVMYRAVLAREAGRAEEYNRLHKEAVDLLDKAVRSTPNFGSVAPIVGGINVLFADRMAPEHRAAAWQQSYDAYNAIWAVQGTVIDQLPVHFKGELLAGLVTASQRTGRTAEMNKHLDKMLVSLAGTPYEATAKQWRQNPQIQGTTSLACKNCHNDGRLADTLARLDAPKVTPIVNR